MVNSNALKLVSDAPDLNIVAQEYKTIMERIKALEEAAKPFKMQLETAALEAPNMTLDLDGFKVLLIECAREIFNTKEAKIKLGEDVLKPFLKTTEYTQLRVSAK